MTGGGVALGFLTHFPRYSFSLPQQLGGFQDPLAQPLCPGCSGISDTSMDPFPLLQLEMRAGLALQCQLPGQLAPEAVAVETQTDVLLNS